MPTVVENYLEVSRAFAKADRDVRLGWRREMRSIARPTAEEIQSLAIARIRNMARSPKWARMRIGVTRKEVYIVPRQKGSRGRTRRPNLAGLLWRRAMWPAAEHHRYQVERDIEKLLDHAADEFNRGGIP